MSTTSRDTNISWARLRIRWRARAAAFGRELGYAVEVAVTAGLIIIGLIISTTEFEESTKVALAILLGTFEVIFLFGRAIVRRLDGLATDSLTVIPRDGLCQVVYQRLSDERDRLLERARRLAERYSCELEKHEMYGELIGLTKIVTQFRAGHPDGAIEAISSVNIEDFDEEPLADAYLLANRKAVARHIVVRRLFILDQQQVKDRQVIALIKKHDEVLTGGANGTQASGVRWLVKSRVAAADQGHDFALFARAALVTQALGGQRLELTQDADKVERAFDTFNRLWKHRNARSIDELVRQPRS